ncbi:MAG: adenylate/guanylate cyclase domain-containing protein [Acidimicrobiia bacterium]
MSNQGGPVGGFVIHLVTYVAVCGFLVCLWAFTSGSFAEVSDIAREPDRARELGFWPIWVILAWGVAVVIHLAATIVGIPGSMRRRRRKARERHRARRPRPDAAKIAAQVGEEIMARSAQALQSLADKRKAPATPSRRWVSVMFTDIADSVTHAEQIGDDEWTKVISRYRTLVRAAFAARGGEEVGTQGDGFLGKFPSPAEAVLCGVDIQRELDGVQEQSDLDLQVRIGIHAGEAVEDDGDLIGRVVNLAARVTGEAEPGEVLVTEPVADYLGGKLRLEDKGLRELKGVPQPRHLLSVRWDADDAKGTN